ncbi:MAG: non-heme iron oxygenase ferredoxin subunit [Gammaproteobacteria bacterium]|nr:non-heme iron oxygenase ferredoxin subunit [Gammaproteobacteria bacterium]
MDEWIDVAGAHDVDVGTPCVVDFDGIPVAVFQIDGEYFAIEDRCTHDDAEIASGRLEGHQIICPRHGARFCLKTGKVMKPPAYEDLACFSVRVRDGRIQLRDDR